jgi:hypothetical protein
MEERFTGGKEQQWVIENGVIRNCMSGIVWSVSRSSLTQEQYGYKDNSQIFKYKGYFCAAKGGTITGGWIGSNIPAGSYGISIERNEYIEPTIYDLKPV